MEVSTISAHLVRKRHLLPGSHGDDTVLITLDALQLLRTFACKD